MIRLDTLMTPIDSLPTVSVQRTAFGDAAGDTTLTLFLVVPPVPVTSQEQDSALAGMHLPPSFPAMELDLIPQDKPAIVRLVKLGSNWVGAFAEMGSDTGRFIDVFSADGHYQGRIDFGTRLVLTRGAPYASHGKLYGVTTDEYDVPFIVVFDLGTPALIG